MAERRSRQRRAFALTLLVALLLLIASVIVYHGGGRTETARQLGATFNWAGTIVAVVAVLMRWKGPWREHKE